MARHVIALLLVLAAVPAHAESRQRWSFWFGGEPVREGAIAVSPETVYWKERGYGFEPGASVRRDGACVTSDLPFYFSAAVPEGNYHVFVSFFNPSTRATVTVKAELRRLMVERVRLFVPGAAAMQRSFFVNVRTPAMSTGGSVHLKEREKTTEAWDWDEKLTLEFNGEHPSIQSITIEPIDAPTVYILGDSTVCDQPREPWASWGQMLTRFLTVPVANHAESGESLRSSMRAGRLDKVVSLLKPGDFVLIQYGHNDMKERGEGVGAFTTYKSDLKRYVAAIKAKGATPVLVTSMHRKSLGPDGKVMNTLGDYPEAVRQVAKEEQVPLVDLHAMSAKLYEALGPERIGKAFQDGTHHKNYGAYELARCMAHGLEQVRGISDWLTDDHRGFNPSRPDDPDKFELPTSPVSSDVKPLGN